MTSSHTETFVFCAIQSSSSSLPKAAEMIINGINHQQSTSETSIQQRRTHEEQVERRLTSSYRANHQNAQRSVKK
jgi:hypothetical protein